MRAPGRSGGLTDFLKHALFLSQSFNAIYEGTAELEAS
jgi:hypothetical protein